MKATVSHFVSVVVPTRDRQESLRQALDSILALGGDDLRLEVIISDNSTTGSARGIAAEYATRYVTASRIGPSAARNAGFRAASGDYIVFLDDDDVFLPTHLRPHLQLLAERPELDAVFGQAQLADETLKATSPAYPVTVADSDERYDQFFVEHPQIGVTVCRMSVRESVGFFKEDLLSCEDWEWNLRLAAQHRIGFVPVPCILFRQRPIGAHDELQWERLRIDTRAIIREAMTQHAGHRPSMKRAAKVMLRSRGHFSWYFLQSSFVHADRGERADQWRSMYRAFRASPLHATVNLGKSPQLRHAFAAIIHAFGL